MKRLALACLLLLVAWPRGVRAQEEDPWAEVFTADGSLSPNLVDLGETTEYPDWMSLDLPFGMSLDLPANYHSFATPSGNTVQLPSASTLFFMAMSPQESGLAQVSGTLGNMNASLIAFLGQAAGGNLDWQAVSAGSPYRTPEAFWGDVLSGRTEAWTHFTGWQFISQLLDTSKSDLAVRTVYLLYERGREEPPIRPGAARTPAAPVPPRPGGRCPAPSVQAGPPSLSIRSTAPAYPLVVGQDPDRRGADILAQATVPPVIYTWYEPLYQERRVCRPASPGERADCREGLLRGVTDSVRVFTGCRTHVEALPDRITSFQAAAVLAPASRAWITGGLSRTHPQAHLHWPSLSLVPGLGGWSGGCASGCSASAAVLRVPFADPGTWTLSLAITTSGTSFAGRPVTAPRSASAAGRLEVAVALPALVR